MNKGYSVWSSLIVLLAISASMLHSCSFGEGIGKVWIDGNNHPVMIWNATDTSDGWITVTWYTVESIPYPTDQTPKEIGSSDHYVKWRKNRITLDSMTVDDRENYILAVRKRGSENRIIDSTFFSRETGDFDYYTRIPYSNQLQRIDALQAYEVEEAVKLYHHPAITENAKYFQHREIQGEFHSEIPPVSLHPEQAGETLAFDEVNYNSGGLSANLHWSLDSVEIPRQVELHVIPQDMQDADWDWQPDARNISRSRIAMRAIPKTAASKFSETEVQFLFAVLHPELDYLLVALSADNTGESGSRLSAICRFRLMPDGSLQEVVID